MNSEKLLDSKKIPQLRWMFWLLLLSLVTGMLAPGCAAIETPSALVELRQVLQSTHIEQGREAAPDLVAEAQRSLASAESAYQQKDPGRARWLAMLGVTQARIAVTLARQQRAQQRREDAERLTATVTEDIARFRSMRAHAEREISRLESLSREAQTSSSE